MTNEEKKAQYGCSIQGYLKYFKDNNYSNVKDAIEGSIKYFLRHGVDDDLTDCSRNELIYVIKNEIAKMVAKELNDNPNNLNKMNSNENVNSFLNNPYEYIGKEVANENKYKIDRHGIVEEDEDKLARNYNKNIKEAKIIFVTRGIKAIYDAYENNQVDDKAYNMINQLKAKLPNNSIEEAFEKQKPGFFERFFRRTSNEYKEFKEAFENYNDKNSIFNGNDQYLKTAAMKYIHHKFPSLASDKLPTNEQIAALSGAGKERVAFCLQVVLNINENSLIQEQADKVIDVANNMEIKQDNEINDDFHKNLEEKVDEIENVNNADMNVSDMEVKENAVEA